MSDTSFTLAWTPPESDGGSNIIEYIIEIKESIKTVWKVIGNTNGDLTNLLVTDIKKNNTYDFRIVARNEAGISDALITEESIIAGKRISKFIVNIFMFYITFNCL